MGMTDVAVGAGLSPKDIGFIDVDVLINITKRNTAIGSSR